MSLTTTVEEMMTPRLLGRVASESGLSEAKVRNGMSGAVASIFGGLAGKATDKGTMGRVVDIISSTPELDLTVSPERVLDDTSPTKASSNALLGLATGDSSSLISRISSMLGIGGKAASGLVAAASSLALAAFKKLGRSSGGLDATKLATTLMDESREINAKLPTGMAAGMIGGAAGAVSGSISTARERVTDTGTTIRDRVYDRDRIDTYAAREEVERAPNRAWWWLAALIPLALLGYWLYNRSRTEPVRAPVVAPPSAVERTEPERDTVRDQPATAPGAMREDTMQNEPPRYEGGTVPTPPADETSDLPQHPGATPTAPKAGPADIDPSSSMTFPAGSVETRFLAHIKSPSGADEAMWFELDQVTFATGKANLEAASNAQIANVAKILAANPNVKVRVGGYTDGTGDAAANQQLSQARAESVKAALVAQGIDANRIDTKGFGEEHKVDATAGRSEANRRAAIRVISR